MLKKLMILTTLLVGTAFGQFDKMKDKAIVTVSGGYDDAATTVNLSTGDGAKLLDPATDGAFFLVWYNSTDYPSATNDPNWEVVRVTARTTDQLTVTRGAGGSTAKTHNTGGKTYKMFQTILSSNWNAVRDSLMVTDTSGLALLLAQGKGVKFYPNALGDTMKVGWDSTGGANSSKASDTLQYYWTYADSQNTVPADKFPLGRWPYAVEIDSVRFIQFSGSSPNMTPTFSYGKYIDSAGVSFGTFSAVTASTTVYRPQAVIVLANTDAWLQWATFSSEPKRWAVSVQGHRAVENRPWFDATSKSETGASGTSLVWSHTVGTKANRYLVVSACLSASSVTSIYWKTTPMVVVASGNNTCYELVNPESGTGDITINFAATTTAAAVGVSYWNVDPATSSGAIDVGQPAPASQAWWFIDAPSTTVNHIVIASVHDGGYGGTSTPNAPGQVERVRAAIGTGEVVFLDDVPANTGTTRASGILNTARNWYARAWRVKSP